MSLDIGVGLPTTGRGPDRTLLGDVREHAVLAEELGLESVWAADHLIPAAPILDSTIALAAAAGATRRVRLGFGVMVLAMRPLAWAAKQLGTLQHVSGGRVLLGVGTGGVPHGTAGWEAAGVPFAERGPRTDAALGALPGLLAGEPTVLPHEPGAPKITLAPAAAVPPILIGGNGPAALRRAAAYGDGWFPSVITPEALAAGVARLRRLAAERGRARPTVTVGIPAALGGGRGGRAAVAEALSRGYGVPLEQALEIPLAGDRHEAAERLAEYARAGAERAVLMTDLPDWRHHYERVAEVNALLNP
ncbi:LLM class flavin-dependent oxidoreductase [Sphaerisporangium corydalis]|uniref:LLM class flavin-dependent oxidoreductase n=1 Tax=Sphaerisporangium corydalis TaxID=1441875 RepID=A0ABV9EP77_9ACTN|nr:LLM class flavin-dependent oxidoreductase [Sphaerisporangium corydalis]